MSVSAGVGGVGRESPEFALKILAAQNCLPQCRHHDEMSRQAMTRDSAAPCQPGFGVAGPLGVRFPHRRLQCMGPSGAVGGDVDGVRL